MQHCRKEKFNRVALRSINFKLLKIMLKNTPLMQNELKQSMH